LVSVIGKRIKAFTSAGQIKQLPKMLLAIAQCLGLPKPPVCLCDRDPLHAMPSE